MTSVDVRRAGDRFRTRTEWLDSWHSFSFGAHYDPMNTSFGVLLANNDDLVAPGAGFDTHPHRDMEIVTWVLSGALVHRDSAGHTGVVRPGLAQRMSAGTGVLHSERNAAPDQPVHFVQMWVLPDRAGVSPRYEQRDVSAELDRGGLVAVVSGLARHADTAAVRLHQGDAALHAARPASRARLALPDAPFVHLYVARGSAVLEGTGALDAGDAARVTAAQGQRLTAGGDGAEILVWEMHAAG